VKECRHECTKDRTPGWMVYGGEIELDGVPSEGQKPTLRNLGANFLNAMGPCIGSARV